MQYEKEFLRKLYRNLLDMRLLEQKMVDTYAQGRVPGHIHSGVGQEASFVGVLANYKEGDYYKRTHRLTAVPYMMGTSLDTFFGELLAKTTGNSGGRGGAIHIGELHTGDLGFSGTLGCDAAVGVGAALTIDAEGRDNLSFVFMGDGTSSRGPVYEAMNLASAWKLPVLFICHNNQFAISTPSSYSIAVEHPGADRAAAFHMPSKAVDGTAVLAVYEAAKELVAGIRAGNGPAILECKDYRWRGHFEGDQCAYRDAAVTEDWIANHDCVKNFEAKLMEQGVITADEISQMRSDFDREMDEAILRAEAAPEMKPEEIYDNLYV